MNVNKKQQKSYTLRGILEDFQKWTPENFVGKSKEEVNEMSNKVSDAVDWILDDNCIVKERVFVMARDKLVSYIQFLDVDEVNRFFEKINLKERVALWLESINIEEYKDDFKDGELMKWQDVVVTNLESELIEFSISEAIEEIEKQIKKLKKETIVNEYDE